MIKVVELFAGVGGFRLGLERNPNFKTIWANQWEPNKVNQFAYECYKKHYGDKEITNIDINKVKINDIPEHDMLVGGFPCQDYSVAQTKAKGIQGKKGVLWWNISKIVKIKQPQIILLENVDRLLKSPSNQRGRDFGIILYDLYKMGYCVEWRVINAAEYGMVQKRKRIFIYAWISNKKIKLSKTFLLNESLFAKTFPVFEKEEKEVTTNLSNYSNILDVSNNFNFNFQNSGAMIDGQVTTIKTFPNYNNKFKVLRDIIDTDEKNYEYLTEEQIQKIKYLKGSKKINRVSKEGYKYVYSEGSMTFPDCLNKPGRTMLTSESTINRSSHYIEHNNTYRKLTPIEAERLNGFDDNWTQGLTNRQRFFTMGNALVVDIIEKIANEIAKNINIK